MFINSLFRKWSNGAGITPPVVVVPSGGGGGKKKKWRYRVGSKDYEFSTENEAREFVLGRVKAAPINPIKAPAKIIDEDADDEAILLSAWEEDRENVKTVLSAMRKLLQ